MLAKPNSDDLRERVVNAVEQEGPIAAPRLRRASVWGSRRRAIDWVHQFRETGSLSPLPTGRKRPKKLVGEHYD
jgi:transposase